MNAAPRGGRLRIEARSAERRARSSGPRPRRRGGRDDRDRRRVRQRQVPDRARAGRPVARRRARARSCDGPRPERARPERAGASRIRGREIALLLQDPFTMLNPLIRIGPQIIETAPRRGRDEPIRSLAEVGIHDPRVAEQYPFQRRRRLVGDQERRDRARAPPRSRRAGACRPRAGTGSGRRRRVVDPDLGEPAHRLARVARWPSRARLGSSARRCGAAAHQRVEHRERVLEDAAPISRAAQLAPARARAARAGSARRSAPRPSRVDARRQQADQRPRGHRLAAARLADDPDRLAARRPSRSSPRRRSCASLPPIAASIRRGVVDARSERLHGAHRARPRSESRS